MEPKIARITRLGGRVHIGFTDEKLVILDEQELYQMAKDPEVVLTRINPDVKLDPKEDDAPSAAFTDDDDAAAE